MDSIEAWVRNPSGSREVRSDALSAIAEVLSQVPSVVAGARGMDTALRDKFVVLSEKAAKLYKQARRPPRFTRSVSCHIRVSVLSSEAPQKCSTVDISQRGASVETTHPFEERQVITLQREDTGKRAKAKVVWVKKHNAKRFTVGLAIMDEEDFWGLQEMPAGAVAQVPRAAAQPKTVKQTK
jgi:hypothetical protein